MNIEKAFAIISQDFPKEGIEFLMIGGHAVNYYGFSRATIDVDFMIAAEATPSVRSIMKAAGFSNISEGENALFFNAPGSNLRVDFLPVDAATMRQLIEHSVWIDYANYRIRVPSLADLIALKLFAIKGGSAKRGDRDIVDIVHLVIENRVDVERDLRDLCARFASDQIYAHLTQQIKEMT